MDMPEVEVKNKRMLLPPQSFKVDRENDRETRIKTVRPARKQPKWILQNEED
jgi:hypothetical protein